MQAQKYLLFLKWLSSRPKCENDDKQFNIPDSLAASKWRCSRPFQAYISSSTDMPSTTCNTPAIYKSCPFAHHEGIWERGVIAPHLSCFTVWQNTPGAYWTEEEEEHSPLWGIKLQLLRCPACSLVTMTIPSQPTWRLWSQTSYTWNWSLIFLKAPCKERRFQI